MQARFESLDVQPKIFCPTANLLGCTDDALSQQVTNTLVPGDQFHDLKHGLIVAKPEIDATGIHSVQQAVLKALHGKSDDTTGRGVQPTELTGAPGPTRTGDLRIRRSI